MNLKTKYAMLKVAKKLIYTVFLICLASLVISPLFAIQQAIIVLAAATSTRNRWEYYLEVLGGYPWYAWVFFLSFLALPLVWAAMSRLGDVSQKVLNQINFKQG